MTEVMAVTHGIEVAQAVLGMFGANKFGHSVAILGVGPLGMCHLAKAAMLGAEKLIATGLFDTRLGIAERFGASLTMNSATTTEAERIELAKQATDGLGPQIVIDCSGVTSTFTEALHMVRPGGVVIEAGTFVDMGPVEVNPNIDFCTRNVTVIGIGGETGAAYEPSLRLMDANQHRYPFLDIITHRAPLEYAQWGVETAQDASSLQVVIDPWATEPVSNPL
jgi:L-iditol 2-dehydrogenase